jgi:hypothetical protein
LTPKIIRYFVEDVMAILRERTHNDYGETCKFEIEGEAY